MRSSQVLRQLLGEKKRTWLVTGAAGFIGSHLVKALLLSGQKVIGLDNFITGHRRNLDEVLSEIDPANRDQWRLIEADIRESKACMEACKGVDIVIHQAALGSVPRSIEDPLTTHACNALGFENIAFAAVKANVDRVVYASSSSVYGDEPTLPKVEAKTGKLLSPYALSKFQNELAADVFRRVYRKPFIGLRYFNVFGPRQDPEGPYAAVIPRWIRALREGKRPIIYGDGKTSRDFTYVDNVVEANFLAALAPLSKFNQWVFNVACGKSTTLNELFGVLKDLTGRSDLEAAYEPFRSGDIRDSLADIKAAREIFGFEPKVDLREGLGKTVEWFA